MIEKQEKIMLKNCLTEEDYKDKLENDLHFEKPANLAIIKEMPSDQKVSPRKRNFQQRRKSEIEDAGKPKLVHMKITQEADKNKLSLYNRTLKFTDKGVERITSIEKEKAHNSSGNSTSKDQKSQKSLEASTERPSVKSGTILNVSQTPTSQFARLFQRVITSSKVKKEDEYNNTPERERVAMPPIMNNVSRPEIFTEPDELSSDLRMNSYGPGAGLSVRNVRPMLSPQNGSTSNYYVQNNWNRPVTKTGTSQLMNLTNSHVLKTEGSFESQKGSPTTSIKNSFDLSTQKTMLDANSNIQPSVFSPRRIIMKNKSMQAVNVKRKFTEDESSQGENLFGITTINLIAPRSPSQNELFIPKGEILKDSKSPRGSIKFTRIASTRT